MDPSNMRLKRWDRPGKGGLRLLLAVIFVAECWLFLYLFFRFRYGAAFIDQEFSQASPFFLVNDRWMDFINPIRYAWYRDPYSAQWGNSPPFMMWAAWAASQFVKAGMTEHAVYLLCYTVCMAVMLYLFYHVAAGRGLSALESMVFALTAVLSFPYVYCFDRGNWVFVASVAIALFLYAYDKEHYFLAAFFLGIAAALKLYPALLGVVFLADKKFRQAVFCAATGIVASVAPLCFFAGGFKRNLAIFLQKSGSYASIGNGVLERLVDDKNSFYQLLLVPKMLSDTPLESIEQLPGYVSGFKLLVTLLLAAVTASCLLLPRRHDKVLVLVMMMLGYPIESGVYNLVLMVFPLVWWCAYEPDNRVIPLLGGGLMTIKSVFAIQTAPVLITWQAVLNPLLELAIVLYIYILRRAELCEALRGLFKGGKKGCALSGGKAG